MEIIPDLNLNKHPRNVKSGSLIDARNIMLTRDGVIVNEDSTDNTSTSGPNAYIINKSIYDKYFSFEVENPYEIIYCIECNIELVIFVKVAGRDNTLSIFRYNEELKQCKFLLDNFEYSGGKLVGDFLYNKENLIIAISEYSDDDSLMIPLRTINLGKFPTSENYLTTYDFLNQEDINQFINPKLHPICPEVRIPQVETEIINGNAPKGWHYIFIRYKISKDTYTKWLNTNEAVFIDSYKYTKVLDYYVSKDATNIIYDEAKKDETEVSRTYDINVFAGKFLSDKTNIANVNYKMKFTNISSLYNYYQIGIINITKDTTNAYISNDISKDIIDVTFYNFKTYNATDIIKSYNNYYNVKTINIYENRIYIANYKEYKFDNKEISGTINYNVEQFDRENISTEYRYYYRNASNIIHCLTDIDNNDIVSGLQIPIYVSFPYYKIDTISEVIKYEKETFPDITYLKDIDEDYTLVHEFSLQHNNGDGTIDYEKRYYRTKLKDFYLSVNKTSKYNLEGIGHYLCYYGDKTLEEGNQCPWDDTINDLINNGYEVATFYTYVNKTGNFNDQDPWFGLSEVNDTFKELKYYVYYSLDNSLRTDIIKSNGNKPFEIYNLYIHFVNKYGEVSQGYPLNLTSYNPQFVINDKNKVFLSNCCPLYPNYEHYTRYIFELKLSTNIDEYDYFISYEKLELCEVYKCIAYNRLNETAMLYNNKINSEDSINFSFNAFLKYEAGEYMDDYHLETKSYDVTNEYIRSYKAEITYSTPEIGTYYTFSNLIDIKSKEIYFSDNIDNRLYTSYINISAPELRNYDEHICFVTLFNTESKYNNVIKELIPCSNISSNNIIKINTRTAFCSTNSNFIFRNIERNKRRVLFNNAIKTFQSDGYESIDNPFNDSTNTAIQTIIFPLICYNFEEFTPIPNESECFNNEPDTIAYPMIGLNTENENEKGFSFGSIIEASSLNDLFKQPQVAYYDKYPIYYTNYQENNTNIYDFTKTLRRSNVIADESDSNNFRFFEQDNYKNLNANKGEIIKLFGVANLLLVHCQYSLFIFNKDNSINSQNGSIQLSAVDIWDIDYKDMFPDRLGYGGLQDINDSVNSFFGYIWYDRINKEFYRLDGANKITRIDYNITNFIKSINIEDICFGIDNKRERLLISFKYNSDKEMTLSYHYNINRFISVHDYYFNKAWITNYNLYMLSTRDFIQFNTNDKCIFNGFYDTTQTQESYIRVIATDEYDAIKMIDSISYKLSLINKYRVNIDDFVGADNKNNTYAGDIMRIYNRDVDTGDIDLSIVANNVNSIENYNKPYYYLGNWNINLLRDKLNEYKQNSVIPDSMTRLYGNYFIVEIKFTNVWPVEIESIYINYSKIN